MTPTPLSWSDGSKTLVSALRQLPWKYASSWIGSENPLIKLAISIFRCGNLSTTAAHLFKAAAALAQASRGHLCGVAADALVQMALQKGRKVLRFESVILSLRYTSLAFFFHGIETGSGSPLGELLNHEEAGVSLKYTLTFSIASLHTFNKLKLWIFIL